MIPTDYDAWVLARLTSNQPVNGELAAVSAAFGPLAKLLADNPVPDRNRILDVFLTGSSDRKAIIEAMAAADPLASAPPIEAVASGSDWPPLRLEELPTVEPFPVDVLPEPAARFVEDAADAIGCPRDFVALPVLAVGAGVIGRSASLLLKDGYFAQSTIFAVCVGPPSDGKTPALKAVASGVREISDQLALEHAQAVEHWKLESEAAGPGKSKSKSPPLPRPRRIDIEDATIEVLTPILADNPRGLVMIRDELSALVLGLNQYKSGGKGSDRANLLKIWSGDPMIKDRVNHEANIPIRCPHPALSITGGLTPDMLGEMADPRGRADGFIDRFLLAYPDPLPKRPWSDKGIPEDAVKDWRDLISRLWMRPLDVKQGRSVPHVVYFTPEGKARWVELYNAHQNEMNAPDFPPHMRGPWGKFQEYAGRLALVLALLHHAADIDADPFSVPRLGPSHVEGAWRLIAYFKSHTRRVLAAIAGGPVTGEARVVKAVVDWVRAGSRSTFTEHHFKQDRRWVKNSKDLDAAFAYLINRNAIRRQTPPEPGSRVGRPPYPSFEVNPALLATQNP